LSGIFPLSGFFSKDEILLSLKLAAHTGGWIYLLIYWLAVFTAFLTAFYTGRAFFMTFWGIEKLPSPDDPEAPQLASAVDSHALHGDLGAGHGHEDDSHAHGHGSHVGHESPPIMTYPLYALAACTILIGLVCLLSGLFGGGTAEWFGHHLHATLGFEALGHEVHHFDWLIALTGTVAGVGGLTLAYLMYAEPSPIPDRLSQRLAPLYEASLHKFRVDELYEWLFVRPTRALAVVCDFLDTYLVDRLVRGVAKIPPTVGRDMLARYQNGLIQFYATISALSVAILLLILLLI
jgi:NADH-quinone oxidoreductase subunit L